MHQIKGIQQNVNIQHSRHPFLSANTSHEFLYFQVSYKTIYNWFNRWESDSMVGLYNKPGRGCKYKFNPEQEEKIKEFTKKEPRQFALALFSLCSGYLPGGVTTGFGARGIMVGAQAMLNDVNAAAVLDCTK